MKVRTPCLLHAVIGVELLLTICGNGEVSTQLAGMAARERDVIGGMPILRDDDMLKA